MLEKKACINFQEAPVFFLKARAPVSGKHTEVDGSSYIYLNSLGMLGNRKHLEKLIYFIKTNKQTLIEEKNPHS